MAQLKNVILLILSFTLVNCIPRPKPKITVVRKSNSNSDLSYASTSRESSLRSERGSSRSERSTRRRSSSTPASVRELEEDLEVLKDGLDDIRKDIRDIDSDTFYFAISSQILNSYKECFQRKQRNLDDDLDDIDDDIDDLDDLRSSDRRYDSKIKSVEDDIEDLEDDIKDLEDDIDDFTRLKSAPTENAPCSAGGGDTISDTDTSDLSRSLVQRLKDYTVIIEIVVLRCPSESEVNNIHMELENCRAGPSFSKCYQDVSETYRDCDTPTYFATGVFISPDEVITNYHVAGSFVGAYKPKGSSKYERGFLGTITNYGGTRASLESIIISDSGNRDLALVQLDSRIGTGRVPQHGTFASLNELDRLITVGTPTGEGWVISSGELTKKSIDADTISYSIPTGLGNSGGGIFNTRGELVGIHKAVGLDSNRRAVRNLGLGTPINKVKEFLNTRPSRMTQISPPAILNERETRDLLDYFD